MKVTPLIKNSKSSTNKRELCLCKTLAPIFCLARLFGFLPISWSHVNNKCTFHKSFFWMLYTFLFICCHIVYVVLEVDYSNILKNRCLLLLLDDLTNAIYGYYVVMLTCMNVYRASKWIKALTKLSDNLRDGLFCQSAMRTAILVQYGYIILNVSIIMVNIGVLCWTFSSEAYQTTSSSSGILYGIMQNMALIFYMQFIGIITVLTGILACFEKFMMNVLQCRPVHPMKGIDESNNTNDFLGILNYKQCNGQHPPLQKLSTLSCAEVTEYVRILHEELCSCIYNFNECFNPQLLANTVIELTLLIIHCYAVIAYLIYTFENPLAKIVHMWNFYSVIVHSGGMFVFLKNAQHLKNMILGLITSLLEYSTQLVTLDEHQQVRMFIEKLKQHRPFSASGVFTVDLGIAGPISANILTYVLVALQFEIPKE